MKKTLRVVRQELIATFHRKAFVFIAFGVPILTLLILGAVQIIQGSSPEKVETSPAPEEVKIQVEGFVDQSGMIRVIPDNIPKGKLLSYETEDQARQALNSNIITAYYVIPNDYIERGEIYYVFPDKKALISDGQKWVIQWTLLVNLVDGEIETADRIWSPVQMLEAESITPQYQANLSSAEDCSRPGFSCQSNDLIRYLPSILVVLFYASFLSSGSMLFNSVSVEKENRTIEVVLLSVNPRQLLAGKTIGLGIAGLLQTVTWMGALFLAFQIGGRTLSLPENFSIPLDILIWSLIFFLGGYALYASFMAGMSALVPKMKEAGSAVFIAMVPLMLGYLVGLMAPITGTANDPLPLALSFFPLTAPIVMIMRLTNSAVPLWQILLSAILIYLTAYFTQRAAATLFQAQNLLSGQSFSIGRLVKSLSHSGHVPS